LTDHSSTSANPKAYPTIFSILDPPHLPFQFLLYIYIYIYTYFHYMSRKNIFFTNILNLFFNKIF
ncbi:MAG: hypothetical protein N7Q72_04330, partial [Spiroplasma sp. Tabriz.8]|nr:hypothetical protein [Spiroplasma sp. Tabriz.8]